MAQSKITLSLAVAAALGLAGVACGGSDQTNPPPQTPQTPASNTTTTTTSGYEAQNGPNQGPNGAGVGISPSTSGAPEGMRGPDAQPTLGASGVADTTTPATTSATGTATGTGMTDSSLTDAQITGVTSAANNGEIEQAREAVKRAKSMKVKQFAQHMVAEHTQMEAKGRELGKKTGITPQDSDVSNSIRSNGSQIMSQLKEQTGADFDKTYIDAQVKEHQDVLDTIDNKLMPAAKNAELKTALQSARDKVANHLKMAKDIQASLR